MAEETEGVAVLDTFSNQVRVRVSVSRTVQPRQYEPYAIYTTAETTFPVPESEGELDKEALDKAIRKETLFLAETLDDCVEAHLESKGYRV